MIVNECSVNCMRAGLPLCGATGVIVSIFSFFVFQNHVDLGRGHQAQQPSLWLSPTPSPPSVDSDVEDSDQNSITAEVTTTARHEEPQTLSLFLFFFFFQSLCQSCNDG